MPETVTVCLFIWNLLLFVYSFVCFRNLFCGDGMCDIQPLFKGCVFGFKSILRWFECCGDNIHREKWIYKQKNALCVLYRQLLM